MSGLSPSRLLRRSFHRAPWLAGRALLVAGLGLIEVFGRDSGRDFAELLWLPALALAIWIWLVLDERAVELACELGERGEEALESVFSMWGVDLRGEPALPRRLPSMLRTGAFVASLLVVALVGWTLLSTTPFRDFVRQGSYVLLLLLTAVHWSLLLLVLAWSILAVYLGVRFYLKARSPDAPTTLRVGLALAAYLSVVAACFAFAPVWVALPILAAGPLRYLFFAAAGRVTRPRVLMRDGPRGLTSSSLGAWLVMQAICLWGPAALVVGLALGQRAIGGAAGDSTPVTDALATAAAWAAGPASLLLAFFDMASIRRHLGLSPERTVPTSVHLVPDIPLPPALASRVGERLGSRGWSVRWHPDPPDRADVRLRLVERMHPLGGAPVTWPLAVSAVALQSPELLDLIARRDRVQRRRLLLRGLRRMLKRARLRGGAGGCGFVIAPHQWVMPTMLRDAEDDELTAHPDASYRRFLPLAARAHAHDVLSHVEVDLLFVEDGVPWKGVERVLRRILEHFDRGRGRIEEFHLVGIPAVRAILHDYELGEPLVRPGYPEPAYEEVARARALNLFRDRGGGEESPEVPVEADGVPVHV